MERKLKIQLAAGQAKKLRDSPFLASLLTEASHTEHLVSTYFDTDDLALYRCGASLRVRTAGDHHVQRRIDPCGTFRAREIRVPVSGDAPDPGSLPTQMLRDSDIGKLMRDADVAGCLKPVCVTRVERSVCLLRLPQGDAIEPDEGRSRRLETIYLLARTDKRPTAPAKSNVR